MPILKNCELHHIYLDPKRPNSRFNKKNPTWEIQIRTTDKDQKKQWEEAGLRVKVVIPNEDDPTNFYWRANLRKKSIKEKDQQPADPVEVVNGDLEAVDPRTIGNGSRGNIRYFQYEYDGENGKGVANVLMGIQLTLHKVFTPKDRPRDSFEKANTEVVPDTSTNSEDGQTASEPSDGNATVNNNSPEDSF